MDSLQEISKAKALRYINATQDKDRYFSDMKKITARLKSFATAQKKVGQSREKPKVMTKESHEYTKMLHNTSVNGIKNIAKNSNFKSARYVITKDNQLHGGDAEHFTHTDLTPKENIKYSGRVYKKTHDSYKFTAYHENSGSAVRLDVHPLLKKMAASMSNDQKPEEDYFHESIKSMLTEGDIYRGIDIPTLKSMAKEHGSARYVITHKNELIGANAYDTLHHYMVPDGEKAHTLGSVNYKNGKYKYNAAVTRSQYDEHPMTREFENRGIKRETPEEYEHIFPKKFSLKNEALLSEAPLIGDYSVSRNKEGDGSYRYQVNHKGKSVGYATLDAGNKRMGVTVINPDHQRRGVGTALHHHIEKNLGYQLKPAKAYSEAGKAFWNKFKGEKKLLSFAEHIFLERDFAAELEEQNKRKAEEGHTQESLEKHYPDNPHHESIKFYTNHSSQVNSKLWNDHRKTDWKSSAGDHKGDLSHHISNLDNITSQKTPHDMTVWSKSIHDPREMSDHNGVMHHAAYMSTSVKKSIASAWNNNNETSNHHLYKIHVPKGSQGAYIANQSEQPHQAEFLLKRGTNLKYSHTETIQDRNKYYHTHHMEVI